MHSAGWLAGLPTASLTLVTAAEGHAAQVRRDVPALRAADRLLVGNWDDPDLLAGETFDTVIADYLVGAVEGFSPYFQSTLLRRLARATRGRLYLVGVDPYVTFAPGTAAGRVVWRIGRFRDACLLLAGEQAYREFPAEWVADRLEDAGLRVIEARRFGNRYKAGFVNGQIDMALMRVGRLEDAELAAGLRAQGEALRREALALLAAEDGVLRHGHDYVIAAEPK